QDADGRWDAATERYENGKPARGDDDFTAHCPPEEICAGECAYWEADPALTGLALLTYLGAGYTHVQGRYAETVGKGLHFLIEQQKPDGDLRGRSQAVGMYCHAMATLALCELWGQTGDDELKPVVAKAVDLLVRCQNSQGGWRYEPAPTGADISVTIMTVMALRSGKNAGLHVPDETFKKAISYIKSCYRPTQGGFTYQPGSGQPGFARTAAGCCVLFLTGEYTAKEIPDAVDYLKRHFESPMHFYYGQYYAVHAMYQVGGKDWEDWYARVSDWFLPKQGSDGSWSQTSRREVGPVYQTSIAVIALSTPDHYLPIFQR
ncbi:MAG TPA: prenyltransferase/squalene oxidase repeat-containing protein, partial [Gemmataceae bacterium]|nr:prenyltransferase/squalene oxidase repeat-containing protein [Gemmataceae bacterium]